MTTLLIAYWLALCLSLFVAGCLIGAIFSKPFREKLDTLIKRLTGIRLSRALINPIISPARHAWETEAVFNPAAAIIGGRTHLIYRAIGADGQSRLGYASSPDGITFDERLPYPIYMEN